MATPATAPAPPNPNPVPDDLPAAMQKEEDDDETREPEASSPATSIEPSPSESGEESEGDDASSVAKSATAPMPAARRAPPRPRTCSTSRTEAASRRAPTKSGVRVYNKNRCDKANPNAYANPMSGSSRKRARSTTDTTTSAPLNKNKSPVLKAIKELKDALAEMNKVGEKREEQIKQWWSQIFEEDDKEEDDDEEEEEAWILQHILSCQKRGRQTVVIGAMLAVTYFTHEKNQSPMLQAQAIKEVTDTIKKMVEQMKMDQQKVDEEIKKRVEQKKVEINRCLSMAKDCGAREDTKEYYVATKLFEEQYNRTIFSSMTTNEGRLWWLKWWCQNWSG